jgi:ABC-type Fe3+/spermidine/putrescine transport system ATPase subunit
VAIRPEDISLSQIDQISCRVEARNYIGNLIDYKVEISGQALRVQTPNTNIFSEGEQLHQTIYKAMGFSLLTEEKPSYKLAPFRRISGYVCILK